MVSASLFLLSSLAQSAEVHTLHLSPQHVRNLMHIQIIYYFKRFCFVHQDSLIRFPKKNLSAANILNEAINFQDLTLQFYSTNISECINTKPIKRINNFKIPLAQQIYCTHCGASQTTLAIRKISYSVLQVAHPAVLMLVHRLAAASEQVLVLEARWEATEVSGLKLITASSVIQSLKKQTL